MKIREIAMNVIGAFVVLGFFAAVALVMWRDESAEIKSMLLGALSSGFALVLGYYYGSSRGSEEKTELLARRRDQP